MSAEPWLDGNNAYLAASLVWLRLRMERLVPAEARPGAGEAHKAATPEPVEKKETTDAAKGRRPFSGWIHGPKDVTLLPPSTPVPQLSADVPHTLEQDIEEALNKRMAAARMEPAPALVALAERFGLSDFERDTLLMCVAMEFDTSMGPLCGFAQGSTSRNYPTFGLALAALDNATWDAMSAHRPLRFARLVEINQSGSAPLTASLLRADERVVNFIKGLNAVDDRLTGLLRPLPSVGPASLSKGEQESVTAVLDRLRISTSQASVPVVQLTGADGWVRAAISQQVSENLNRKLYQLGLEALPTDRNDLELLARLWQRESILLGVALYIDAETLEDAPADATSSLQRFLSQPLGLVMVGVRDTPLRLRVPTFVVEVSGPTAREQFEAWKAALEGHADDPESVAADLAGEFRLNLHDIGSVAQTGIGLSAGADGSETNNEELRKRLWEGSKALTRPRLDMLAQRLDTKAGWDDLILPAEQTALMRQIAGQVRERYKVYEQWGFSQRMNRGFGISALFAGESGTGKTMAAEVIANDLNLHLYRIDLSAVVSKYIGETEKNLRRLFDAAEQGGSILFFDEADALFGKRSEVKDSHDRYANIEINYLLQRMESFSGLAVLATNMKTALDPAFVRRLRFIVNFPFPGIGERRQMWAKALPPETPAENLDYDRLARLSISGGNIHSIALNAAFAAAQSGRAVTMPVALSAARTEMRKLDKPIHEAEFR